MGGGDHYHITAILPQERDLVPTVQDVGWARGLVWMGAENLAPLRFGPQTVQPILSPYTDYAILAH
jgi:hypothetical protein